KQKTDSSHNSVGVFKVAALITIASYIIVEGPDRSLPAVFYPRLSASSATILNCSKWGQSAPTPQIGGAMKPPILFKFAQ
ncbi:Uncharacterized protein APZ42_003717, partial [Daphnia magna]